MSSPSALNLAGNPAGQFLNTQVFKASGTYTPTSGSGHQFIRAWAAGGGAGTTNISQPGSCGGGGAYVEGWVTNGSTQTVTIGAGGTGGLANNVSNGAAGTNSSFGSLVVAAGGQGAQSGGGSAGAGGTTGACTVPVGGLAMPGGVGQASIAGNTPTYGGIAFSNVFELNNSIVGASALANSAQGGSGGTSGTNGGAGGSGLMVIYEYT